MARQKVETIKNLGQVDKLTVQKSLPLLSLSCSDFTLGELKILDVYLSRIDSRKPDKRAILITKGELEKALGVQKINNKDLEDRLKHLMQNVVKITDDNERKGFKLVTLFEEAEAKSGGNGQWQVKLQCTRKAMKYIFNIENLGYLRYKLRCIASIMSRATYVMYNYLEANRFRKSWEIPLAELRTMLNCDNEETYKDYKRFNDRLLKRVQAEINNKTECQYKYEPVKEGKSVVAVKFTVKTRTKAIHEDIDPNQLALEDININRELWVSALECDGVSEFTTEQINEIREVLVTIPESRLPEDNATYMNDIQVRRYHYIAQKYAALNRTASEQKIRNRFGYLMATLRNDARE